MANKKKYTKRNIRKSRKSRKNMKGGENTERPEKDTHDKSMIDAEVARRQAITERRLGDIQQKYKVLKYNLHDTQLEKEKLNNDFDKYLTNISKEISEFKSMPEGAEKNNKLSELQSKYGNLKQEKEEHGKKIAQIDQDIQEIQENINKTLNDLPDLVSEILGGRV